MARQDVTTYYQDNDVTLYLGDALDVLTSMPGASVDCIVTSPPYYNLRDYGHAQQLGAESSVSEYTDNLVALFREARRVLADDGTFWLNLGDGYGDSKQLRGVPWRAALALQDDGWILRNDVIWHKPNAMPEPVKDRLSARHEHIFMFAKSVKYGFDLDPIREDLVYPDAGDGSRVFGGKNKAASLNTGSSARRTGRAYTADGSKGKNPGDMWSIATTPFKGAHFATFPLEIPRRAIAAGCKPGGTVLDMFNGSGTTGAAAQALGRKYVGIDINEEYLKLTLDTRLQNGVLDLGDAA